MPNFKGLPIKTFVKLAREAEAAAERNDQADLKRLWQQLDRYGYTLYSHKPGGDVLSHTLVLKTKRR